MSTPLVRLSPHDHDTDRQSIAFRVTWLLALPYPVRNMLRRWRGLIGMIVGVGLSLGIAMTMSGVGKGAVGLFTSDFVRSGADLYVATEGGTLIPILPGDQPGTIRNARRVLAQIRGISGVDAAIGVMSWSLEREREGPRRPDKVAELIIAMGVDGEPTQIPEMLVIAEGRWLRRSNEVVLGSRLSREKKLGLGTTIRLAGRDFEVVGIGKLRGFGLTSDSVAYLDYRAFRDRAGIGDVAATIAVDTARPDTVRARIAEIGDLTSYDPPELVRLAEAANASGVAFRWILAVMTLGIAALFVSNMLSRSVAERRLEFATLRAIGIPTTTILATVAAEALLVGIAAGFFGILISLLLGELINRILAPSVGVESLYLADVGSFVLVFALAIGLSVIAGLFPAREATSVDPVEVLREA
ncbi:MAG: ABC transporter permease [Chloroflexi bacterium]|nr:ABC transporter permease [Chloroflexota bacterium]